MRSAKLAVLAMTFLCLSCGGTLRFDDDGASDTGSPDTSADTGDDTSEEPQEDIPPDAFSDGVLDTIEDFSPACISAGCLMSPDAGPPCCAALDYVASCPPWDPSCTAPVYHCADCGNGLCDPHEAAWSCLTDCATGCDVGATFGYACSPLEGYDCTCSLPECVISCEMQGVLGFRWTNSCSNETYSLCSPTDHAECRHIGTDVEGWYAIGAMGGETLVATMPCANHWICYGYD